jgi:serine/threonine protein kinase/Tfp pilus assembly protein PilF
MDPERWQKLEELFHAALERGPDTRASFVAEACSGDDDLRRELESMLDHEQQAKSFIESPAYVIAAESILRDPAEDSLIGKTLGSYQIVSQLGKGGMGVVYLATDQKLQRKVALKMLPPDLTDDPTRVQRFKQEARAASALNHPNILTIFEIEERDGQHYIATEFVEGSTLRDLKMSLQGVLDAAIQITSALAAAHASGIVHRDIKPENIMRRTDGYIKVLDFGLAKLIEQAGSNPEAATAVNTDPGIIIGTVQYMSPEQIRRAELDERTDIWSLGVVIYEMMAGESPFKAATESDVIASILQKKPSFEWRLQNVPPEVEWILKKALAKDKEERYQTARDLLIDLKRLRREMDFHDDLGHFDQTEADAARSGKTASLRSKPDAPVESARKANRAPSGSGRSSPSASRRRSRRAINSLAIMPLVNASADPNAEYLSDGITESIINNLSQLPNLRVMARSTVFRYKGREVDPLEAGRELGVRAVMTGRVLQLDDNLVIRTELVHVADGTQLWGEHYNRKLGDIFAVQEEISKQISEKLQMRLSGEEEKRLTKRHTENPRAYQLYLQGRYHWNKRDKQGAEKGIEFFQRAIEVDPNYALAYAGLADSYIILGFHGLLPPNEVMPKAKQAAEKALQIDDSLAEARISLAYVTEAYDWDWPRAEREYKHAIRLNSNYATAHHWYGEYLALVGRFDEAIAELQKAKEIDESLSLIINAAVGLVLYLARQYDRAIEEHLRTLELDPNFAHTRFCLGLAYLQKSMFDEAIAELQASLAIFEDNPRAAAVLAYAYAISGKRSEAQALFDDLKDRSLRQYIAPYLISLICTGLGDHDQAFAWLEKGCDERDLGLVWLKVEPLADSLRSDPRFEKLLRRVGFPA